MTYSYRPTMPPYPFVPPFDPPNVDPPPIPRYSSGSESGDDGSASGDDASQASEGPPGDPEPEVKTPPPINVWPRLPPHHPYHLPPGYSWPDNLPPGHPGQHVRPPRPDIGSGEWAGEGSGYGDAYA